MSVREAARALRQFLQRLMEFSWDEGSAMLSPSARRVSTCLEVCFEKKIGRIVEAPFP